MLVGSLLESLLNASRWGEKKKGRSTESPCVWTGRWWLYWQQHQPLHRPISLSKRFPSRVPDHLCLTRAPSFIFLATRHRAVTFGSTAGLLTCEFRLHQAWKHLWCCSPYCKTKYSFKLIYIVKKYQCTYFIFNQWHPGWQLRCWDWLHGTSIHYYRWASLLAVSSSSARLARLTSPIMACLFF